METGLFLRGQVIDLYRSPDFVSKETGELREGKDRVALMVRRRLSNNELRPELYDLSCHDAQVFDALLGKVIEVCVGETWTGKEIKHYIPKGSKPEVCRETKDSPKLAAAGG